MTQYNDLQLIKRQFFALRNGIIADTLRKSGSPFRMIFGLNIPQIVESASQWKGNADFARRLWADTATRESMMAACVIMPFEEMTLDEARKWIASSPCYETTDFLCHQVLRHLPEARILAGELINSSDTTLRYAAVRLMWNIYMRDPAGILEMAKKGADDNDPVNSRVAASLVEEIRFMLDDSECEDCR
ncbi:MAG: DNA alkylation repair protein [Paramuribaculum sp.]|nr:DNA alkylation repair protein [Paramuribaculum sp.]MDE6303360.1 DNA alkylation repair protein [Paramuribaculum sp.]